MHVVSHAKIIQAQAAHPTCSGALDQWCRLAKRSAWQNFAEVKASFSATDKVRDKFVFDIGGNKLRLIAAIHFNVGIYPRDPDPTRVRQRRLEMNAD